MALPPVLASCTCRLPLSRPLQAGGRVALTHLYRPHLGVPTAASQGSASRPLVGFAEWLGLSGLCKPFIICFHSLHPLNCRWGPCCLWGCLGALAEEGPRSLWWLPRGSRIQCGAGWLPFFLLPAFLVRAQGQAEFLWARRVHTCPCAV